MQSYDCVVVCITIFLHGVGAGVQESNSSVNSLVIDVSKYYMPDITQRFVAG